MTSKKTPIEAVTDILASAQSVAEGLAALTDLARAGREVAALSHQLLAAAERVEDLIDRLAPRIGCTVEDVYGPLFRSAAAN